MMTSKKGAAQDTVYKTSVASSQASHETRWLLLVMGFVFVISASVISHQAGKQSEKVLAQWQINAFKELNNAEMAVFSALETAALEINDTHELEDEHWMAVRELEELFIPPFARDNSWEKQGKLEWTLTAMQNESIDIAMYISAGGGETIGGTFLLLLLHDHAKKGGNVSDVPEHPPYEIWFHTDKNKTTPEIITDQAFITAGWREVMALTGQDELIRTKGKEL